MCRSCGQSFSQFTSLQNLCGKCAYNRALEIRKNSKAKAPIQQMGKKARAWVATRQDWIKANPPDKFGLWDCYLRISPMCQNRVDNDTLSLDHIYSRSARPDLRLDFDNIKPCCYPCNSLKGSTKIEILAKEHPHLEQYVHNSLDTL